LKRSSSSHWSWIAFSLALFGCGNRKQDPVPPATSVVVPTGAPGAIGAMAAGRAPEPTGVPPAPGEGSEDDDEPPLPMVAPEIDSGVTL